MEMVTIYATEWSDYGDVFIVSSKGLEQITKEYTSTDSEELSTHWMTNSYEP